MSLPRFLVAIVVVGAMAGVGCEGIHNSASQTRVPAPPNVISEVPPGVNGEQTKSDVATGRFPDDRPLSESVSLDNQHLALAAIGNGDIPPGDLFATEDALKAFQSKVVGAKGWLFQPLSKENFREYRVLVNGNPCGFLTVEGRLLDRGRYEIRQVGWWNERNQVEWRQIHWDNIPHVLNSVVLGEVPNAERLFSNRTVYDKLKVLFPDRSWEFRVEVRKGGLGVMLVDVIHDGKPSGTLTLSEGKTGIEEIDYEPLSQ